MRKKKTRRQQTENAAVNPQLNLKSRYEELEDIGEYFHTLPPDAQKWLNNYTENFVNASFSKEDEDNLVNIDFTKTLIKECLKNLKKNTTVSKKVKSFVNKYLIRSDNVPIQLIKDLFFEDNEKKQLRLLKKLKEALLNNIKNTKKREVNKVIKIIEKEVYNTNNSRNRCILTKEKAAGTLNYIEELTENEQLSSSEDELIAFIDLKNSLNKLKNTDDDGNNSSNNT